MATLFVLLVIVIGAIVVWAYEKYKQELYVAQAIDGAQVDSRYVTQETTNVIEQLKDKDKLRIRRYANTIALPDGQEISYRTDVLDKFKDDSNLNYEPTATEWSILRGVVKKLYSDL